MPITREVIKFAQDWRKHRVSEERPQIHKKKAEQISK